ncbi:hypothetical protein [Nocardia seriolae]|nr:hypothetical protein [Nocardia seriolae]MTJ62446.1 hypothetical protein [Nocardia seriolae]MTK40394.1 hypothetical protein [Nocardia seriolae]QOW34485.1 hypothetical protein IMZ23_05285 [Nocardia seriolae]QUN18056.1 hypothetical protein KEC46_00750 [Nocardia seriolae]WKY50326.1 hypothetical protein Q5P07_25255 [Nocardia seriolae]
MATKLTVLLPDEVAVRLKRVAGEGKQSEYIARAVRQRILEDDLRKLAAFEAERGGPDLSFVEEGTLIQYDE